MSVRIYALHLGRLRAPMKLMIEGGEGEVSLPIVSALIEHPKGLVLFDSGMHPDCQTDPASRLGARTAALFGFDYAAGDEVGAKLAAVGRDPAKIAFLVNSHLHFDHAGGNAQIPNATLLVQRLEWEAAMDAERAMQFGFDRRDIDLGHKILKVEGEHDLFGDGRIVTVPTYGHTPGHQSLRVRADSGEVVLTGDACYFCRTLRERRLPRFVHDREAMLASLERLAALEAGGARLAFGHDPEFWDALPQAPAPAF